MLRNLLKSAIVAGMINAAFGVAAAEAGEVLVNNRTSTPIYYIYVSPSSSDYWGPDRLGTQVLMPGDTGVFPVANNDCVVDVKLVDQDGDSHVTWGLNACTSATVNYVTR